MATTKAQENRTARLTVLIDPDKKAVFEQLCARQDQTPSQVVRRLIREYIEAQLGRPWTPGSKPIPAAPRPGRSTAEPARGRTSRK